MRIRLIISQFFTFSALAGGMTIVLLFLLGLNLFTCILVMFSVGFFNLFLFLRKIYIKFLFVLSTLLYRLLSNTL